MPPRRSSPRYIGFAPSATSQRGRSGTVVRAAVPPSGNNGAITSCALSWVSESGNRTRSLPCFVSLDLKRSFAASSAAFTLSARSACTAVPRGPEISIDGS